MCKKSEIYNVYADEWQTGYFCLNFSLCSLNFPCTKNHKNFLALDFPYVKKQLYYPKTCVFYSWYQLTALSIQCLHSAHIKYSAMFFLEKSKLKNMRAYKFIEQEKFERYPVRELLQDYKEVLMHTQHACIISSCQVQRRLCLLGKASWPRYREEGATCRFTFSPSAFVCCSPSQATTSLLDRYQALAKKLACALKIPKPRPVLMRLWISELEDSAAVHVLINSFVNSVSDN